MGFTVGVVTWLLRFCAGWSVGEQFDGPCSAFCKTQRRMVAHYLESDQRREPGLEKGYLVHFPTHSLLGVVERSVSIPPRCGSVRKSGSLSGATLCTV